MVARLSLATAAVVGFASVASAQIPSDVHGAAPTTISMSGEWAGAWPGDSALAGAWSSAPVEAGSSSGWATAEASVPVVTPVAVTGVPTTQVSIPIVTASVGTGSIISGKNATSTGNSSGNTVTPPSPTTQSTNNAGSMVAQVGSVLAGVAVVIGFVL